MHHHLGLTTSRSSRERLLLVIGHHLCLCSRDHAWRLILHHWALLLQLPHMLALLLLLDLLLLDLGKTWRLCHLRWHWLSLLNNRRPAHRSL